MTHSTTKRKVACETHKMDLVFKDSRGLFWLTVGSAVLFLCRAHHDVMTDVYGNDPMLYMRGALTFVTPGACA